MRTHAVALNPNNEVRNSYGNSILGDRGLLAWAETCARLQVNTPIPKPVPRPIRPSGYKPSTDIDFQLTNILVQIALQFVEGG